jgi:hypothetical protein
VSGDQINFVYLAFLLFRDAAIILDFLGYLIDFIDTNVAALILMWPRQFPFRFLGV